MYRPLFVEVDVEGIKRREAQAAVQHTGQRFGFFGAIVEYASVHEFGKPGPVRRVTL